MNEELKPCPFCGCEARIYEEGIKYGVTCIGCPAQMEGDDWPEYVTLEEIVVLWNKRAGE